MPAVFTKKTFIAVLLITLSVVLALILNILVTSSVSIVATPAFSLDTMRCATHDHFQCWRKRTETITRALGPRAAMNDLRSLYTRHGTVVAECHQLAHAVGNTAFEHYGDVAQAFAAGDPFCWSGYYHGVMETAIPMTGRERFLAEADKVCAAIPGKERYSFDYYNCIHGLGHGLMAMDRNALFVALNDCDALSGDWERRSCYGGVFMENIMNGHKHLDAYLKPDDLLYPCNAVSERHKEECYKMQTSYMLSQNGGDFRHVFTLCKKADDAYQATCAESAGRDASGRSASNIGATIASCNKALDDAQKKHCYAGAVRDFISYFHSDTQAQALCAAVEEQFRDYCHGVRTDYARVL